MHPPHRNIARRVNNQVIHYRPASIYAWYASHFRERKDSGK